MSSKTATLVKSNLPDYRGKAHLYRLEPPVLTEENSVSYVVVSAAFAGFTGPETYIFEADEDGNVLDWIEMDGSYRGGLDHESALRRAGYKIIDPNEKPELAED